MALMAFAVHAAAQDPVFSMFYLNKVVLNPAYTGVNRDLKFTSLTRIQWTGLPGKFQTTTASLDVACPSSKLGFGAIFYRDVAGDAFLTKNQGSFNLAAHLPARYGSNFPLKFLQGRKFIFSAALNYSIAQKNVNWDNLVFTDQLDQILGIVRPSDAPLGATEVTNVVHDVGAGLLFRSEINKNGSYISVGAAGYHLNSPVETFYGNDVRIPIRWNAHLFMNFRVSRKYSNQVPIFFTVGGNFDRQQALQTLQMGGAFTFGRNFLLGMWYRNQTFSLPNINTDAAVINMVYSTRLFSIGYSFDLTVSKLGIDQTQGTHEFGLSFRFDNVYLCKKKSRLSKADRRCFLQDSKFFKDNDVINYLP
jgi:type IX secretion system PorP/SprF family membrane protein